MKKIENICYLGKARNGEHYQLYSSLLNLVTEEVATKYGVISYQNRFAEAFANENKAYLGNQTYIQTTSVSDKNTASNRQFRALDLALQSKQLSTDTGEAEAAERLLYALKPYKDAPNKAQTENIAMVKDLVDLYETDYAEDVTKAGVSTVLDALKTAVTEFEEALYERADEQLARSLADNMKKVRPVVDSTFEELSTLLTAVYIVAAYVEEDSEKANELEALINAINARILHFHKTLARRNNGSTEKDEENPTDPDPENPDDETRDNGETTPEPDDEEDEPVIPTP